MGVIETIHKKYSREWNLAGGKRGQVEKLACFSIHDDWYSYAPRRNITNDR